MTPAPGGGRAAFDCDATRLPPPSRRTWALCRRCCAKRALPRESNSSREGVAPARLASAEAAAAQQSGVWNPGPLPALEPPAPTPAPAPPLATADAAADGGALRSIPSASASLLDMRSHASRAARADASARAQRSSSCFRSEASSLARRAPSQSAALALASRASS